MKSKTGSKESLYLLVWSCGRLYFILLLLLLTLFLAGGKALCMFSWVFCIFSHNALQWPISVSQRYGISAVSMASGYSKWGYAILIALSWICCMESDVSWVRPACHTGDAHLASNNKLFCQIPVHQDTVSWSNYQNRPCICIH